MCKIVAISAQTHRTYNIYVSCRATPRAPDSIFSWCHPLTFANGTVPPGVSQQYFSWQIRWVWHVSHLPSQCWQSVGSCILSHLDWWWYLAVACSPAWIIYSSGWFRRSWPIRLQRHCIIAYPHSDTLRQSYGLYWVFFSFHVRLGGISLSYAGTYGARGCLGRSCYQVSILWLQWRCATLRHIT